MLQEYFNNLTVHPTFEIETLRACQVVTVSCVHVSVQLVI